MREGWQVRRIGEIANHVLGKMLDKAKNKGDLKPYLRNLNVRWFEFDLSDVQEMRFTPAEVERYSVKRGDLVICEGGYPGRGAIWDEDDPVFIQKALHRVRFSDEAYGKWCLYFLHSEDLAGRLKRQFTGSGIQHFTGEALSRFELPIPPLDQTRRIVAILDEAFEAIATAKANAEKNLLNAREVFNTARDARMYGHGPTWRRCRLGDVAQTQYGLSEPMNSEGIGYKIFRMGEVQDGRLEDGGQMKRAAISPQEFEKYRLRVGDVLFNRTNSFELVGKTGIFTLQGEYCFASYLVRVLMDRSVILPTYLNYLMNTARFQEGIKTKAAKSVNQANINATHLGNEEIAFPIDLATQAEIVANMDGLREACDHLRSTARRKLAALDELKKSLLHQAFSGTL